MRAPHLAPVLPRRHFSRRSFVQAAVGGLALNLLQIPAGFVSGAMAAVTM